MAALFLWIPIVLVQLFLSVVGMNLSYPPRTIEVVRWRQPVCATASPCYRPPQAGNEKVVNVREIRSVILLEDLEPSSIAMPEMYEKPDAVDHNEKPRYTGLYAHDEPSSIIVTKVIDLPIVAMIVTSDCIDGVPSCEQALDEPFVEHDTFGRTFGTLEEKQQTIQEIIGDIQHKKDQVLEAVLNKTIDLVDKFASKTEAIVDAVSNHNLVESVVDAVQEKKDQVVKAVSNVTVAKQQFVEDIVQSMKDKVQPVIDAVHQNKDHVAEAVSNTTAAKQQFVGDIVQSINDKVQPVIDAVHQKKDHVAEAVSNTTAAKQQFVEDIVQSMNDKVQPVIDAVHQKKDHVAEAVSNTTAAKQPFVEDIVQSMKDKVQPVIDAVHQKKDHVAEAVSNTTAAKQPFVGDIVQSMKDKVQPVIDAVHQKKDQVAEAVSNFTAAKQQFIEDMVQRKKDEAGSSMRVKRTTSKDKVQDLSDAVQEKKDHVVKAVSNVAAAKQQFVKDIVQSMKDKVQSVVDAVHEKKDHDAEAVSNTTTTKQQFVKDIVQSKKDEAQSLVRVKRTLLAAAELIDVRAWLMEIVSYVLKAKVRFIQDLVKNNANAKDKIVKFGYMGSLNEFSETMDIVKQELPAIEKLVQKIAERKIFTNKKKSEKTQEYNTASLIRSLLMSQIEKYLSEDTTLDDEEAAPEFDYFYSY